MGMRFLAFFNKTTPTIFYPIRFHYTYNIIGINIICSDNCLFCSYIQSVENISYKIKSQEKYLFPVLILNNEKIIPKVLYLNYKKSLDLLNTLSIIDYNKVIEPADKLIHEFEDLYFLKDDKIVKVKRIDTILCNKHNYLMYKDFIKYIDTYFTDNTEMIKFAINILKKPHKN